MHILLSLIKNGTTLKTCVCMCVLGLLTGAVTHGGPTGGLCSHLRPRGGLTGRSGLELESVTVQIHACRIEGHKKRVTI